MAGKMLTCTWAPTTFANSRVDSSIRDVEFPDGSALERSVLPFVRRVEELGLSHLLVAQRWWGSGEEMEGSSLDVLAMTAFFAAHTKRIELVSAIHPGFFEATAIAKWGATMDWLTGGRWSINVTSGWNMKEFDMYGIDKLDHDARYTRSKEFIEVLRAAWDSESFSYEGRFYRADELVLEPRPSRPLTVFQGGQSEAAIGMAAQCSDWMFLNGGTLERIEAVIGKARKACEQTGRTVRFALYAAPLVRPTDAEAWAEIDRRIAAIDREPYRAQRARLMCHWRNDTSKAIVVVAVEVHEPKGFGRIRMRRVPQASGKYLLPFVSETIAPARSFTPTDYPFTSRYPNGATVTNAVSLLDRKALRTSRCLACTALPLCLRDGCWELTRGPSKCVSLTTISTNTLFGLIGGRHARAACFSTDCSSRLSRPSPSRIATS